jgi:hypothetical protein
MSDEERDDLKATAESIVQDAETLKDVELRKLNLGPAEDEQSKELAAQAEELADDISHKARVERDLADKVADSD